MGSTFSTYPSPFAALPIELVHYVLELSLQPPSGRLGLRQAWVARVARVSKSANAIATPRLYYMIQLEEGWTIVLLATTLANRPDLAHGVRALHIAVATTSNRHDLARSMAAKSTDTRITVRNSYRQLIAVCNNAFVQVHNTGFDPHGLLTPYRHLSITCTMVESRLPDLELLDTTHLHFGMGNGAPGWVMLISVTALAQELGRNSTWAITHIAFDWDPESKCCGDLFGAIANLIIMAPPSLQRITVRFPVFTTNSKPMHRGRRQDKLRRSFAAIDDPRVCLAFVEVRSTRTEDRMHEMALEGWRRHAQGHEDLWMSGHPVYLV